MIFIWILDSRITCFRNLTDESQAPPWKNAVNGTHRYNPKIVEEEDNPNNTNPTAATLRDNNFDGAKISFRDPRKSFEAV